MAAGRLGPEPGQLELFTHPADERRRGVDRAVDQINQRFGKSAIKRGG